MAHMARIILPLVMLLMMGIISPWMRSDTRWHRPLPAGPLATAPSWLHLQTLPAFIPSSNNASSPKKGCSLPRPDPWDPEILEYVSEVPEVHCASKQLSLLYTSRNLLHLNSSALEVLGLAREHLTCVFSYIAGAHLGPKEEMKGSSVTLSPGHNSLAAQCSGNGSLVYENILLYVPYLGPARRRDGFTVVLFVIESLSQSNLLRSLPKTLAKAEEHGGVLLRGHHKVGKNSVPNVMALLEGDMMLQFGVAGWTTMMLEDAAVWGSSTTYSKGHIDIDYTDAYKALSSSGERLRSENVCHQLEEGREWSTSAGYRCQQEHLVHRLQVATVTDFLTMYSDRPTFTRIHLSESTHDSINMVKHYDEDLERLLVRLSASGALNNTLFLLLGDHGYRAPRFAKTRLGTIENNMPGLVVIPPARLAREQPQLVRQLTLNCEVLTSHIDVNRMLVQVLDLSEGKEGDHGGSLFSRLGERTCSKAGVPLNFCSCAEGLQDLHVDKLLVDSAAAVLSDLNTYLSPVWGCRRLALHNVTRARTREEDNVVMVEAEVIVVPGDATFIISTFHGSGNTTARVVRQDMYRDTSLCVPEEQRAARPYCICAT